MCLVLFLPISWLVVYPTADLSRSFHNSQTPPPRPRPQSLKTVLVKRLLPLCEKRRAKKSLPPHHVFLCVLVGSMRVARSWTGHHFYSAPAPRARGRDPDTGMPNVLRHPDVNVLRDLNAWTLGVAGG